VVIRINGSAKKPPLSQSSQTLSASEFMELLYEIETLLGQDIHKSGESFYSSINTLKKGKYLIVGLNPGGDPKKILSSIKDSFQKIQNPEYNAYYENWLANGKKHRLQENLKTLFAYLEYPLRDVCATNIIYERTRRESDLTISKMEAYKQILSKTINLIEPEVIITFGRKPYNFLLELFPSYPHKTISIESGHSNWTIELTLFALPQQMKVIGLPHLSVYTLYNRPEKMQLLKDFCKPCT